MKVAFHSVTTAAPTFGDAQRVEKWDTPQNHWKPNAIDSRRSDAFGPPSRSAEYCRSFTVLCEKAVLFV